MKQTCDNQCSCDIFEHGNNYCSVKFIAFICTGKKWWEKIPKICHFLKNLGFFSQNDHFFLKSADKIFLNFWENDKFFRLLFPVPIYKTIWSWVFIYLQYSDNLDKTVTHGIVYINIASPPKTKAVTLLMWTIFWIDPRKLFYY